MIDLQLFGYPVGVPEIGRGLVLLGLMFAQAGMLLAWGAAVRGSEDAWRHARVAGIGFGVSLLAANALMVAALLNTDFSVGYVAEVGNRALAAQSPYFTFASLWASLNGSILFWGGVLGIYVLAFIGFLGNKHREYSPWALAVLLSICLFFAWLVAGVANPFHRMDLIPPDGPGPNPLLQNHWLMAFHPPALYMGYVGMAVPFSMCSAALLAGRLDAGWMVPLRRSFLVPWAFLTVGIAMGGWWSYAVLGWGGYWAWDPVENASFMPWLAGTAFLHSAMVLQRNRYLTTWTLFLGMSTFLLTMLGTFMTRSGVFNSVHSFTKSDIGPIFLVFIVIASVYTLLLLAFRVAALDEHGRPEVTLRTPWSREIAILAQNVAFTVFTAMVLFGVLYPLIVEVDWRQGLGQTAGDVIAFFIGDPRKVSVGEPYFDKLALPIGTAIVFLMGVGPAVPWGGASEATLLRRFAGSLAAGVVTFVIAMFTVQPSEWISFLPYTAFALAVCAFAAVSNLGEFVNPLLVRLKKNPEPQAALDLLSRGRRRWGGHLAHYGVILAVVAIAMSSSNKVEKDFVLSTGQTGQMGRWTVQYQGTHEEQGDRYDATVASFGLAWDGEPISVEEPRLNFYKRMREPVGTPAVHSMVSGDVYISLMQVTPDGGTASIRMMTMPLVPWLWVSPVIIALGTLIAAFPTLSAPKTATAAVPEGASPA